MASGNVGKWECVNMVKKTSLSTALHEASGKKPTPVTTTDNRPEPSTRSELPPVRQGKKMISGYFDPAVARQLKQLALDNDSTVQALLGEALNELFIKYNKKPIA